MPCMLNKTHAHTTTPGHACIYMHAAACCWLIHAQPPTPATWLTLAGRITGCRACWPLTLTAPRCKELRGMRKGSSKQNEAACAVEIKVSVVTTSAHLGGCLVGYASPTLMNQTFPSLTFVSKSAPRTTTCSPFSSDAVATVKAAAKSTRHAAKRIDAIVIDWLVRGVQGAKQRIEVVLIKR